jgi:hypothetical protein
MKTSLLAANSATWTEIKTTVPCNSVKVREDLTDPDTWPVTSYQLKGIGSSEAIIVAAGVETPFTFVVKRSANEVIGYIKTIDASPVNFQLKEE